MSMDEAYRHIIEDYMIAYNTFNIEGMLKHMHVDVVFENRSEGQRTHRTEGIEALRQQAETASTLFNERKQTIKKWCFLDHQVRVTIDYQATLATELPNGLKKGDTLSLSGYSTFFFKNDLIIQLVDES